MRTSFMHVETPLKVASGPKALQDLARELERSGIEKAVVICGRSFAAEGGGHERLRAALGTRLAGVLPLAAPHSPVPKILEAAAKLAELGADAVIAVGGGSAIVTARAASILLAEQKPVEALATYLDQSGAMVSPRLLAPKLPQFVVATTPTTAMVKAGSAVLDPVTHQRRALFDPQTRAKMVVIDPDLLTLAPRDIFVSAGLNTLSMAVEGLIATKGDPMADAGLAHALHLCVEALPRLNGSAEAEARHALTMAAILCGRATDSTNGGLSSALGHAIGARYGVENGIVNGAVLGAVLGLSAKAAGSDLDKVAHALGVTGGLDHILARLAPVLAPLGLPKPLREFGVAQTDIPELAAVVFADWFLRGNPKSLTSAQEVATVLAELW